MPRVKGAKDKEKRKLRHSSLVSNVAIGAGGLAAIGGLAYLSHQHKKKAFEVSKEVSKTVVHPSSTIPVLPKPGEKVTKILPASKSLDLTPTQERLFPGSSRIRNNHGSPEIPISPTTKMPKVVTDSTTKKRTFVGKAGAVAGKTKQVLDSVHTSRRTVLKAGAIVAASKGGEVVAREANPVVKAAQLAMKTKRAVKEAQDLGRALSNNGGKPMSRRGFLKGAKNLAIDYGKAHPKQTVVPVVKGYAKAVKIATDPVGHMLGAQKLNGISQLVMRVGSATGLYSDNPRKTTNFNDSDLE